MNGDGKLYIRAIQEPRTEKIPEWVVIDTFDGEKNKKGYFLGTKVYNHKKDIVCSNIDGYGIEGIRMYANKNDVAILPDITMYVTLGIRLKNIRMMFNKKTRKLMKNGE